MIVPTFSQDVGFAQKAGLTEPLQDGTASTQSLTEAWARRRIGIADTAISPIKTKQA